MVQVPDEEYFNWVERQIKRYELWKELGDKE